MTNTTRPKQTKGNYTIKQNPISSFRQKTINLTALNAKPTHSDENTSDLMPFNSHGGHKSTSFILPWGACVGDSPLTSGCAGGEAGS